MSRGARRILAALLRVVKNAKKFVLQGAVMSEQIT